MIGHSVIIVFGILLTAVYSYVVPEARIERLTPRGIRVSVPDEAGVQFFAFHANVNDPIRVNEQGSISGEVPRSRDKNWTFQDQSIILRNEDVLHYWIYVQANGKPYTRVGDERITPNSNKTQNGDNPNCLEGITAVRGSSMCRDRVIFEETFDTGSLSPSNNSPWAREIIMPMDPDYEFCIYRELPKNVNLDNGILRISPLILDDEYGENSTLFGRLDLGELCTGSQLAECSRRAIGYSILPPVVSARLTTKKSFYFRYGKIEIRAKFPKGDWLYPELWLEPKYRSYGIGYSSGRVVLGMTRGNEHLTKTTDSRLGPYGSTSLEFGLRSGSKNDVQDRKVTKVKEFGTWTEGFHIYTTIWNEDGFRFQVDGEDVGELHPPPESWLSSARSSDNTNRGNVNKMAPFDNEFYITVGLGVGGTRVFPDGTASVQHQKPWRNVEAKAMLRFWQAKDEWLPSWMDRNGVINSQFQVDYIKVTSI